MDGGPFKNSGLTTATFEEGTTSVVGGLFYDATALKNVTMLDTMTSIGNEAFRSCSALEVISIPSSVTSIGKYAFYMCEKLQSMEMPDSITSVGEYAFSSNASLRTLKLSEGITKISPYCFYKCTSLINVSIPKGVTMIDEYAFSGCTGLTTISLPEGLQQINSRAFYNCGLLSASIPAKCSVIEAYAFAGNTALEEVELSDGITEIGAYCFQNCDALSSVTIPDSVKTLGTNVFKGCDTLAEVHLGSGITQIQSSTFADCPLLNNVVIPYKVTSIGSSAFANCTGLTSITIPRTVTSISTSAFSYKDRLTIYGVPGTYAETFANTNGCNFVGQEYNATSVSLSATELTIYKGKTAQLTFTVDPPNFTDNVEWKSLNENIARVNDGVVTARATGQATIRIVVGDSAYADCLVTVVQPVTSISLNKTAISMDALETFQLKATVKPDDAYNKDYVWKSSNPEIAAVDSTGLVTAYKKGTATLTVTAADGSGVSSTCKVTVNSNSHLAYTASQLESSHPYASNSNDIWVLTAENATYVQVTFDPQTNVESPSDTVYVYGKNESPGDNNAYTGSELAGKTIRVSGDTIKIQLISDGSLNMWGFKVTDLETDGVLDPYAEIRAGLTAAAALETDSAKLEAVRALDSDLLAEAMALEDGSVAEIVKQLESGMNVNAQVVVTDAMKQQFSADKIDLTGAAMNVSSASYPVTLTIDSPQSAGSYVGTQYSNVVDFSMTLGNAIEPLEVPVMLTMPVPQGIDPNSLVIIHELKDGSTERVGYNISYPVEGTAYVSFVLTGFSDFRMAQAVNDVRGVEISGNTASVEVFCSAANTSVICASYDPNGKMLSVDAKTLSAAANWQDVSLSVAAGAYRVGILLIDGSHKPLAESLQFIV